MLRGRPRQRECIDAANAVAMMARHREELASQGFTVLRDAISPQQLSSVREALTHRNGDGENPGARPLSGACLVCKHRAFRDVALHPTVLAIVEALLGDDCVLSSCNSAHREPGCDAQGLHRDTGIWGASMPMLAEPVGIQTAWCVDDFSEETGGTRLVPGSHRAAASVTGARHASPSEEAEAAAITVTAPAGSIILFDAQMLHGGGANRSRSHRRACLTLFVRSWLKPQHDLKR